MEISPPTARRPGSNQSAGSSQPGSGSGGGSGASASRDASHAVQGSSGQGGSPGAGQSGQPGQQGAGASGSGPANGQGSGRQPGGGARSPIGGGGDGPSTGPTSGEPAKDNTQPSPPSQESQDPSAGSVRLRAQPATELTLQRLHEALQDDKSARFLEDRTGISHEKFDQFTRQYEKVKSGPAGPGRNIEVKSREQEPAKPAANLPGLGTTQRFGSKNIRERNSLPEDTLRGLKQDVLQRTAPGMEE